MTGRGTAPAPASGTTHADAARPPRAWITVASRDHVRAGLAGGFMQACHGQAAPLRRMRPGDWVAFYSPTVGFAPRGPGQALGTTPEPCRAFTALARVGDGPVAPFDTGGGFVPHRRAIVPVAGAREAPIVPLLGTLAFIPDPRRWGFPFRRGHFEITPPDLRRIAGAMGIAVGVALDDALGI